VREQQREREGPIVDEEGLEGLSSDWGVWLEGCGGLCQLVLEVRLLIGCSGGSQTRSKGLAKRRTYR
jgi:hypothetical protein